MNLLPILLLASVLLLYTLHLVTEAFRLLLHSGWQQFSMGVFLMHWATIWVKEQAVNILHPQGGCPEHNEIHQTTCMDTFLSNYTKDSVRLRKGVLVITIQQCTFKERNPATIVQWLDLQPQKILLEIPVNYCRWDLLYKICRKGSTTGLPVRPTPKGSEWPNSLNFNKLSLTVPRMGWNTPIPEKFHCIGWKWIVWCPAHLSWGHMVPQGIYRGWLHHKIHIP